MYSVVKNFVDYLAWDRQLRDNNYSTAIYLALLDLRFEVEEDEKVLELIKLYIPEREMRRSLDVLYFKLYRERRRARFFSFSYTLTEETRSVKELFEHKIIEEFKLLKLPYSSFTSLDEDRLHWEACLWLKPTAEELSPKQARKRLQLLLEPQLFLLECLLGKIATTVDFAYDPTEAG